MSGTSYAIALGSNRRHGRHGAPERVIAAAVDALADAGLVVRTRAPVIRSAALGPAGRGFANSVVLVATPLDPPALLALLKGIERSFGRRRGRRWGPRVLDLDIALWSEGRWPRGLRTAASGRLTIPHAGLAGRGFVLAPLASVAPGWRDPRSGLSVRHMLHRLTR